MDNHEALQLLQPTHNDAPREQRCEALLHTYLRLLHLALEEAQKTAEKYQKELQNPHNTKGKAKWAAHDKHFEATLIARETQKHYNQLARLMHQIGINTKPTKHQQEANYWWPFPKPEQETQK